MKRQLKTRQWLGEEGHYLWVVTWGGLWRPPWTTLEGRGGVKQRHGCVTERVRQQQAQHSHLHDGHQRAVHPLGRVLGRVAVVLPGDDLHRQCSIYYKLLEKHGCNHAFKQRELVLHCTT